MSVTSQATLPAVGPWCRACGTEPASGAQCLSCGAPLDGPDPGPARVGQVVVVPGKLMTRHAVAVSDANGVVTLMAKKDATIEMPYGQFDGLRVVTPAGPPVLGAAGRLWWANHSVRAGAVKGKWAVEAVEETAVRFALASLGARRAAAVDALALGMAGHLERLGINPHEIAWYQARAAALTGNTQLLLDWLEALPPQGYEARVWLLFMRAKSLMTDPGLRVRARSVLAPFLERMPDAYALHAALDGAAEPLVDVVSRYAPLLPPGPGANASFAAVAQALKSRQRLPVLPSAPAPHLRAFDAYLAGLAGASLDSATSLLVPLPVTLLDELVDQGALKKLPAGPDMWPREAWAHLRCRLTPGQADETELRETGFHSELARRYFLASDETGLARLPAEDPAVRHYRALLAFQANGRLDGGLRPPARQLLELLEGLRGQAGMRREAPEAVAADASCWPLIREQALRGDIDLSEDLRARYPEFDAWLRLCVLQSLVFAGRWEDVRDAGRQLMATARLEKTRDEALNMVAFALWQLGRTDEALRLLEEALDGQFTTGLVVNAALVAGDQGCLPAFRFLAQALRLASDPRVRQGALGRAIALWLGDDAVPDFPEPLRLMVRDGLNGPQVDDVFHAVLLRLCAIQDREWLSDTTTVQVTNPVQGAALRYFRVRARVLSERHSESFVDVAAVLVDLWKAAPPRPDWVARERTWLVELLQDVVHSPFGEAFGVAPVIDTLVAGGALDLIDEIILSAQAGAHVAKKLDDDDAEISPDAERRFIHETIRKFRARRSELGALQEGVAEELGRCVCVAAFSVAAAAERYVNDLFGPQWDAIIDQLNYQPQLRWSMADRQRRLLDQVDAYVARCRAYLQSMDGLPLNETGQKWRSMIVSSVHNWSTESSRLRSVI
jgi:hypothetical protein